MLNESHSDSCGSPSAGIFIFAQTCYGLNERSEIKCVCRRATRSENYKSVTVTSYRQGIFISDESLLLHLSLYRLLPFRTEYHHHHTMMVNITKLLITMNGLHCFMVIVQGKKQIKVQSFGNHTTNYTLFQNISYKQYFIRVFDDIKTGMK